MRDSAGHYESWYLKANHPEEPLGLWIRYTIHKAPGEQPQGAVWFTFFETGAGGPVAAKERGLTPGAGERQWVRLGEAAGIGKGRAFGYAGECWWELSYDAYEEPLFHLPTALMYRTGLPRTKLCSPIPHALVSGRVGIGDRQLPLDGWRGMIGHNWGAEHAEEWVWLHALTSDGDWLDAAIGRVKLGNKVTPWIANGAVSLSGERHALGGLGAAAEVSAQPGLCQFHLTTRRLVLAGDASAELSDTVGWRYADPAGGEHHSLNCSVASMRLRIEPKERPVRALEVQGSAAYELGTRDTAHGIELQPFPDP